VWLIATYEMVN